MKKKKNKASDKRRKRSGYLINIILTLFVIFFLGALLTVFNLKVTHEKNGTNLENYKIEQYEQNSVLKAKRGTIYDTNGTALATDIKVYDMYAILDPSYQCYREDLGAYDSCYVDDPGKTAQELSDVLGLDDDVESFFEKQLNSDAYQVEFGNYGKNLSLSQKEAIDALGINGILFNEKTIRYYPYGDYASYIIGYAQNYDGQLTGEMGIEQALDGYLSGIDGSETQYVDANGVKLDDVPGIPASEKIIEPQDGTDVYLTLDSTIQSIVENEVKSAYAEHPELTYDMAFTVVMDAKNGDILAAYKEPSFDPNVKDIETYQNPFTDFCYEPGSVMKTMTIATAYEIGVWDETGTYPTGSRSADTWGGVTISDWVKQGWGNITFAEAYYVSSNTVTTMIEERIGNDVWDEYTTGKNGFGFGEPVETEFFQTPACTFDPKYQVEYATSSFGQGITVNSLQMLRAYSAITNNGVSVTPHIVSKITDPETGDVVYDDDVLRDKDKQVISEETSDWVLQQMKGVVNYQSPTTSSIHGTARAYQGSEYPIGTKTGTAEYANENGQYVEGTYIDSTMNVVPVDDPELIIYTIVKDPSSDSAILDVLPQYVKNISDKTLEYMNSENYVETKDISVGNKAGKYIGKNIDDITDARVVKIGTGKVQKQYPKEGQNVTSNIYVFGDFKIKDYDFTNKSLEESQAVCISYDLDCQYKGTGQTVDNVQITNENKYILTLK